MNFRTLTIKPKSSFIEKMLIKIFYILAVIAVIISFIHALLKVVLIILLIYLYYVSQKNSIFKTLYYHQCEWLLNLHDDQEPLLLTHYYMSDWIIILYFQSFDNTFKRTMLIYKDAIKSDTYRQLKVILKYSNL